MCNLSFSTGVFPDAMKIARVIPLFKSGDKHVLLIIDPCLFCHNFLRFSEDYLITDLIVLLKKGILSECQYGFRNSRSTYMALMDLVENICESVDKKKYVMGIFIDLKKAFDTIDHNILLRKP